MELGDGIVSMHAVLMLVVKRYSLCELRRLACVVWRCWWCGGCHSSWPAPMASACTAFRSASASPSAATPWQSAATTLSTMLPELGLCLPLCVWSCWLAVPMLLSLCLFPASTDGVGAAPAAEAFLLRRDCPFLPCLGWHAVAPASADLPTHTPSLWSTLPESLSTVARLLRCCCGTAAESSAHSNGDAIWLGP